MNDFKHLSLSQTETKDGKLRPVISMSANISTVMSDHSENV